jgi:GxxExxY protein
LQLEYKGRLLKAEFLPDLICFDKIVVELKAVVTLIDAHRSQIQNYLRSTGLTLGLLANFGHYPGVEVERIAAERGRFARQTPQGDKQIGI